MSGSGRDGDRSLEYYQERMHELDDQMLDSTRRSVQKVEEAVHIGAETMVELDDQGETLNRAERRLDDIDQDLRTSQRTIRQIRSVFGGVVNWFSADKLATTPSTATQQQKSSVPRPAAGQGSSKSGSSARSSSTHPQHQQQKTQYRSAQEEEVDKNLMVLSGALGTLKSMGEDMGDTLQAQNDQIERMSGRVTKLDVKVNDLKTQTRKLT